MLRGKMSVQISRVGGCLTADIAPREVSLLKWGSALNGYNQVVEQYQGVLSGSQGRVSDASSFS